MKKYIIISFLFFSVIVGYIFFNRIHNNTKCDSEEYFVLYKSEFENNKKVNETYFNQYCSNSKMVILYSDDGIIIAKTFFLDGLFDGKQTTYNFDGKVMITHTYKKGKKDGVSKFYNSKGQIIKTEVYVNDKLVMDH